jgi:hypothetical protein
MTHGHDDHGGHDAHASHDHPAGSLGILDSIHDAAEIPPEPAVRSITPAPEEYAQPWPGAGLLWPLVWTAVCGGFLWSTTAWHGEVETPHAHAAPHEGGDAHEAPEPGHAPASGEHR